MKRYWILLLLIFAACGTAARAASAPKDFPVTVHVARSQWRSEIGRIKGGATYQILSVVIDGKKYELEADLRPSRSEVLKVGDYKAALETTKYDTADEISETYVFSLHDGTTRKFVVVGESE